MPPPNSTAPARRGRTQRTNGPPPIGRGQRDRTGTRTVSSRVERQGAVARHRRGTRREGVGSQQEVGDHRSNSRHDRRLARRRRQHRTGGDKRRLDDSHTGSDTDSDTDDRASADRNDGNGQRGNGSTRTDTRPQTDRNGQGGQQGQVGDDGESRNKRRRRRRKNRGGQDAGPQGEDREQFDEEQQPVNLEPVRVEGYLDLRDEGYGFIRVNNYLASKSDSYVPVKLSRQDGLRRGDHVAAISRPAGRNEKNPAVLEIVSVNGRAPDEARRRPRFEDL